LIDVQSAVPNVGSDSTEETCTPALVAGHGYRNTINAITGAAPKSQIYSYVSTDATDVNKVASRIQAGLQYGIRSTSQEKPVCPPGQSCTGRILLGNTSLRPSWRQLQ
jgi:hypothetical protein